MIERLPARARSALAVPLVLAGVVTIYRLGHPVTALSFVVLWLVMVIVSAAKKYPFLNERTSTFLLTVTVVVAAVGVAGVAMALRRRDRMGCDSLPPDPAGWRSPN